MPLLIFLLILLGAVIIALIFAANGLWQTLRTGLPYVTTPSWVIQWLEEHLHLSSQDTFYELGCGDARVLAAIAKKYPQTKCIGIEIQWWPFLLAKWRTRTMSNVTIINGDVFNHDLRSATVVFGFYITKFTPKIAKKLKQELRPGTHVFSFGFSLDGWIKKQRISPPPGKRGSALIQYQT